MQAMPGQGGRMQVAQLARQLRKPASMFRACPSARRMEMCATGAQKLVRSQ
jgi:hypothetical protein